MARRSSSPSSADPDTIAAPATPPGGGLRAVVRVSGPRAAEIAGGYPGAVLRRGPRSYTREDLVEIHLPGAAPLVQRCLRLLAERGARSARPGEFTLRAFLNGRLDLVQAEAVERVIAAGDDAERRAAVETLGGGWSKRLRDVEATLLDLCADVEAAIDFSDQDIEVLSTADARARARGVLEALRGLAASTSRAAVRDGLPVVALFGRPNAGKSTLFNALGGDALVSPAPGTTRDVLAADVELRPGLRVRLLDTAGVFADGAAGPLDGEAGRRASQAAAAADVTLLVVEVAGDLEVPLPPGAVVVAANKIDLGTASEIQARHAGRRVVPVSGRTGEGLPALREALAAVLRGAEGGIARVAVGERQASRLREAEAALQRAEAAEGMELVALDLRSSLESLGAVTGRDVSEELLDRVFSRFCLGK